MSENEIAKIVFEAYKAVLEVLGPGLLEKAYETALVYELKQRGLDAKPQVELPIVYKGITIEQAYRLDILVNSKVILELKAVDKLIPVHRSQLLTYLKMSGKKLGLLINFGDMLYADGFKRVVNCEHPQELDEPRRAEEKIKDGN